MRWLTIATGGLVTAFIVSLGYGLTTVEVMELFTGLPAPIRTAQIAIAGAVVSATALVVTLVTRRRDTPTRMGAASGAVILGTAVLGVWAWAWHVLPV